MTTPKQIELRIKYAKTSLNTLTKKLSAGKAKVKVLEADLKKAKACMGKKKPVCGPRPPRKHK